MTVVERCLLILAEATVRGSALIVIAVIVAWLLRRRAAAVRSVMWTALGAALLLLPVLSATVPPWRIAAPAALAESSSLASRMVGRVMQGEDPGHVNNARSATVRDDRLDGVTPPRSEREPNESRGSTTVTALFTLWAVGALIVAGHLLVSMYRLKRLERRASKVPRDVVLARFSSLIDTSGIDPRVKILEGPSHVDPMTWGIARPRVLLPAGWEAWPPQVAAAVLAHEMAHVRRHDIARQLPWDLANALFWFNPLVRFAARQARVAHEQACDDAVVNRGVAPTTLADALLALARESRGRRVARMAVSSGGRTELATRIAALVDSSRARQPARIASAVVTTTLLCLTLVSATLSFAIEPARPSLLDGASAFDEGAPTVAGVAGRALDSAFTVLRDRGLSGTVLVATDARVIFAKGFGFADRARRIPAEVDTRYHVAGITKAFTAAAVADLIDRGLVSADARVAQYLPEVGGSAGRITVHELLTHTDGLDSLESRSPFPSSTAFLSALGATAPAFAAGTAYGAADVGHSVLAALVERVTERPFEAHVRDRFLRPAAMHRSFFRFEGGRDSGPVAVGYTGAEREPAASPVEEWGVRGSRGLVATAHDLRRWYIALTSGRLVRQGALDLMFAPYVRTPKPFDQGYGWLLYDEHTAPPFRGGPIPVRRRSGREPGFEAELVHDPNGGWLAVVLLNADDGRRLAAMETIRAVMNAHPPPRR